MWQNSKFQIVTKLKNWQKTEKEEEKTQNGTIQKLKRWQNSNTIKFTKLKKFNFNKTQNIKF